MVVRKKLKKRLLRAQKSKSFALLVWVEILLVLTLILGLIVYVSPEIDLIPAPLNKFLFVATISVILAGLAILLYVFANRNFVKKTTKEKLGIAKKVPQIPALLVLEFFLIMVLVVATFIYLDSEYNVIAWPFNVFLFLIVLGIVAYLYTYSEEFRKQSRGYFSIRKRW
ncbi:hypothetical protein KKE06_02455 [Candidatus Micrarchaeota archaeon]|nr:hypothetical protein [Candidatus Micrarchaeota archaeon]MBU1930085.1 hypothetical protein [Candidatus Micrarchaeota archaeon]